MVTLGSHPALTPAGVAVMMAVPAGSVALWVEKLISFQMLHEITALPQRSQDRGCEVPTIRNHGFRHNCWA